MGIPTLNIIGCGQLGRTVGRLWHERGVCTIQGVLNRSRASAEEAVRFIGAGSALHEWHQLHPAELTLIGTPDQTISYAAERLLQTGLVSAGQVVFHCSGALSSSVLAALKATGATIASAHPIRSFADPARAARDFGGTWCGLEGDPGAVARLESMLRAIDGLPIVIDGEAKPVYHAAAVFASNYLVTLLDVALDAYARAGVPRDIGIRMIEPLVRGTIDNVFAAGTEGALTGPVARGDVATVLRQYRALLTSDRETGRLYKALARRTRTLARRRDRSRP